MLAIPLIVVIGLLVYFFYHMGSNDTKALANFPVAYGNFDQVISDLYRTICANNPDNIAIIDNSELNAHQALNILMIQASVRISSLTRNDGDLMKIALEIAALAETAQDTLKAYRISAVNSAVDKGQLAEDYAKLRDQRRAAYSRYLELGK